MSMEIELRFTGGYESDIPVDHTLTGMNASIVV
jgi:hypothetical protein